MFVIDPDPATGTSIEFRTKGIVSSVQQIVLGADEAFELLCDLLEKEWRSSNHSFWIPAARHKILSKLFSHRQLNSKNDRFKIELLLQGLKSRDVVYLEAFAHIPRLKNYGCHRSTEVLI